MIHLDAHDPRSGQCYLIFYYSPNLFYSIVNWNIVVVLVTATVYPGCHNHRGLYFFILEQTGKLFRFSWRAQFSRRVMLVNNSFCWPLLELLPGFLIWPSWLCTISSHNSFWGIIGFHHCSFLLDPQDILKSHLREWSSLGLGHSSEAAEDSLLGSIRYRTSE